LGPQPTNFDTTRDIEPRFEWAEASPPGKIAVGAANSGGGTATILGGSAPTGTIIRPVAIEVHGTMTGPQVKI
jgi:hypothetical protein